MSASARPPASRFPRASDLRQLGSFEFSPKALVEGYFSGRHRSKARGISVEFHDYRQYVPGDDLAMVDWRVYARSDRHYLRTYEQETNLECDILLDSSASMGFGAPLAKLEYASYFAAALCHLVTRQRDRVSLTTFDEAIRSFHPPGSTTHHLHSLMQVLEHNRAGSKTSLAAALRRAFPLLKRKGTLVVISDFWDDPSEIFAALSAYLHRGFRVFLFHILDAEEIELKRSGLATFVDSETGARVIAHADDLRASYQQAVQDRIANLRSLAMRKGIEYDIARTDRHFFHLFDHLLK